MTPNTPQYATLSATPDVLRALLAAAGDDQMAWKPSAERWSISEVLAHLADVERQNIFARVRAIATEDAPKIVDYDQNERYALGVYSKGGGRENLDAFCRAREESLSFLAEMPRSAWQRETEHHVVGTIRIENLMNLWAFHDLSHIRQVSELLKATCFWDGIGPLQHYYSVAP
jgi:hypothetical protein